MLRAEIIMAYMHVYADKDDQVKYTSFQSTNSVVCGKAHGFVNFRTWDKVRD